MGKHSNAIGFQAFPKRQSLLRVHIFTKKFYLAYKNAAMEKPLARVVFQMNSSNTCLHCSLTSYKRCFESLGNPISPHKNGKTTFNFLHKRQPITYPRKYPAHRHTAIPISTMEPHFHCNPPIMQNTFLSISWEGFRLGQICARQSQMLNVILEDCQAPFARLPFAIMYFCLCIQHQWH